MLTDFRERRRARAWASQQGRKAPMVAFQKAATDLAFQRERHVTGRVPANSDADQQHLLALVTQQECRRWKNDATLIPSELRRHPISSKALVNMAALRRYQGQYDQALAFADRAVDVYSRNEDAYFLRGAIAIHQSSFDRAAENLLQALRLNRDHVPSLNLVGRLYFNQGRAEAARTFFERARALEPENVDTLIGLYAIEIVLRRTAEADALERELERVAPQHRDFAALKQKRAAAE